ncbi:MAG: FAD:protein FMN transferase [Planctomycetes bacterium]|nr:FAD:protein FMN transferase [Planctomycetota bacterium]
MTSPVREFALSRRSALCIGLGAFVVASLPLAIRRRRAAAATVTRTIPVMGTVAEFAVVAPSEAEGHAAIDAAADELVRIEREMTRYDVTSDVGRVNDAVMGGHASGAIAVSADTAQVVREALLWADASDGSFDPCLGGASELWNVERRTSPPDASQLRRYAGRRLHRFVDVDTHAGSPVVLLRDADIQIDLGGIAKGWAVDRAGDVLRARGINNALVNVGGDLVALGHNADGEPWHVGVRSPTDPNGICAEIDASDIAIATSGDYERCFVWHGRRYHHILDPQTAEPRVTPVHSITVIASTCMSADAAATACYGMPRDRAEAVLASRAPGARLGPVV